MPFRWLEDPKHIQKILQKIMEFEESKKVSAELKKYWQEGDEKRKKYRMLKDDE